MMHLVTGGSGSGKSAYAESLVLSAGCRRRIYIATMRPYGEEGLRRVARHRLMRSEKQFETIERYTDLAGLSISEILSGQASALPGEGGSASAPVVLLECISNLTANELYDPSGAGENTLAAVTEGVQRLRAQASTLVLVTNEVFSDGIQYDPSTMRYLELLGKINQTLAQMADTVTEVVYGIPLRLKACPESGTDAVPLHL